MKLLQSQIFYHHDLKPKDIFVDNNCKVYIGDFSNSILYSESIAPEINAFGILTFKTEVFAS